MTGKRSIWLILSVLACLIACEPEIPDTENPDDNVLPDMGTLDISFAYVFSGIPMNRIKRVELSLAYTADQMYQKDFFTTTNVSEAITHYYFYLPPGEYYYHATIICLCEGDTCRYAGFPGQFGTQEDGGKVEIFANKTTKQTTQFH